ncbi:aminomethyltransferase [Aliidongia dinghuensis]|uniref:aminomethyltransferase n=1 Tax=Aliidongia dinghuensis TaxID=1867774 RepID=A0A8J2YSI5_9PROT|nr:glycine cleavage system aminomethyltransferase GcvT [Aliidongia dinghuensis]GGF14044.1 aminomethyltransferase [Aliidongia dinghuensis]
MSAAPTETALKRVPLHELHAELGAKFVPFAGYDMPVQYKLGVLGEHLHTRAKAGLFDVSHMGQLRLRGANPAAALETLVPGDIQALKPWRTRYTLLTNDKGGVLDDLMVTNLEDHLFLIVNAATKDADIAHLKARLGTQATVEPLSDRALLALQGPAAVTVLARLAPSVATMAFMTAANVTFDGIDCFVTRSGYTGEDGYEISVPAKDAERFARLLLKHEEVAAIGLGARDSLRLEAGLCLYGNDIDETTTVIEADLAWAIGKRRRTEGGFPGAAIIQQQLAGGAPRCRVGILPEGKAPAREHTEITDGTQKIGEITSGGFGPSQGGPVAMGYVDAKYAEVGTAVTLMVRGVPRPAQVVALPFVPHRYYRG